MEPTSDNAVAVPKPKSRHNYRRRQPTRIELDEAKKTALYMGNGVFSSVQVKLDGGHNTNSVQDKTALAAYSGFNKLYGERKDADLKIKACSIKFLDLPAELKNAIYRSLLVPETGSIDFSPKTTSEGSNASSIFYGEVEFRFTSIKGYYVLDTFSHTACVRRANSVLEAHGKLKSLRLILPDTYLIADVADEEIWAGGLDVTLIRLHGGLSATFFVQSQQKSERRSCLQTQIQVKKYAQEQGWKILVEPYDVLGTYPVELAEGDVVDEIPDEEA
ncbi:hypothetical protein Tdes44962_MAKER05942 [Teratosphaeria destructans]|uniref:Uncharacterized protein n=1 Tax=Teratosphaeria destructans TaxID=418781 RepID=A0A9W7SIM7_9PEZI|nr:hypothetical protein Tdes44962_MAKER05942 [Teratosphaeria destructans]